MIIYLTNYRLWRRYIINLSNLSLILCFEQIWSFFFITWSTYRNAINIKICSKSRSLLDFFGAVFCKSISLVWEKYALWPKGILIQFKSLIKSLYKCCGRFLTLPVWLKVKINLFSIKSLMYMQNVKILHVKVLKSSQ